MMKNLPKSSTNTVHNVHASIAQMLKGPCKIPKQNKKSKNKTNMVKNN